MTCTTRRCTHFTEASGELFRMRNSLSDMDKKQRIEEIDFLKCVCILLMIAFHLVFIGHTYPVAKQFVYTFHMPVFLLISGYFARTQMTKDTARPTTRFPFLAPFLPFLRSMWHLFVPYAVMETAYAVTASRLPVYEHIDHLTPLVLLDKVLLHPIGPYWYLHTLILCSAIVFAVMQLRRFPLLVRFVLTAVAYWFCARVMHLVMLSNAFYFLFGVLLRQAGVPLLKAFCPRWWVVLPLAAVVACVLVEPLSSSALVTTGLIAFDRATPGGILLVWCVVSLLLFTYKYVPAILRRGSSFLGLNTLLMLLFSPVFTMLAKSWQPWMLAVDATGMLFMVVSVGVAVGGSLAIGWLCDKLHLSRYLFVTLKTL